MNCIKMTIGPSVPQKQWMFWVVEQPSATEENHVSRSELCSNILVLVDSLGLDRSMKFATEFLVAFDCHLK
jgi:hypothetical protein